MRIFSSTSLDAEQNYQRMTEQPVKSLVLQLATPTIISMLITTFYNMTDTIFVSRLGTESSAAVGIVYSIMSIIQSIGVTLGQGSANTVSRLLGAKQRKEADQVFSTAFFTSIALALLFSVLGLSFTRGFVRFLGSTPTIEPYAVRYASVILIGAPWMAVSYTMNNNLRSEGKAFLGMIGMSTGAILNVILDPIFIFALHMGIQGAALATVLSQGVSFAILISHFLRKRSNLTLGFRYIRLKWWIYRSILVVGAPSLFRTLLHTVSAICLNVFSAPFGDEAIAAMSITTRVMQFLNSALIGFGQGLQPVAGFSWGAKRYDRLVEAFKFCVRTGVFAFTLIGAVCFVGAKYIMLLFLSDPVVVAIGTVAIRYQCILMPLSAYNTLSGMVFQSTGHGTSSSILALARQGFFFVPVVSLLPLFIGLQGVQLAQPIADIATFILSLAYILPFLKKLRTLSSIG
ncbi:MAG: MATE family efflux transporter [Sphaerochaeta sp.]|uniref:MATE family efflux transporter n=1 Tax=Sphaerochaeta sp. TaxID=1972642 RepID=UPI002FC8E3EF